MLGGPPRSNSQIRNFRRALNHYWLTDLGFTVFPFTLCNRRCVPNTVQERLDRACANARWSQLFLDASRHEPMNSSDHTALVIRLVDRPNYENRGAQPWRLEVAWLHPLIVK
ncbi:UNVERIFIED_CONTAM: hypothetical protein Sindi_0154100, partial [Sesamum indicum]